MCPSLYEHTTAHSSTFLTPLPLHQIRISWHSRPQDLPLRTVQASWTPVPGSFTWQLFAPVESFRRPVMLCVHSVVTSSCHGMLLCQSFSLVYEPLEHSNWWLWQGVVFIELGTVLSTLYALSHLILTTPWGKCSYYPYSIDKETEAQRG